MGRRLQNAGSKDLHILEQCLYSPSSLTAKTGGGLLLEDGLEFHWSLDGV